MFLDSGLAEANSPSVLSPVSPHAALRANANPFHSQSPAPFGFAQSPVASSASAFSNNGIKLTGTNGSLGSGGLNGLDGSFNPGAGLDIQGMNVDGIDLSTSNGPTAFMNLLNDGSFDMNALFNPSDFGFSGQGLVSAPSPVDRVSSSLRNESSGVSVSP